GWCARDRGVPARSPGCSDERLAERRGTHLLDVPRAPAWHQAGGTSEATPEFAGVLAIADQYAARRFGRSRLGLINPALYRLERSRAPGIVDVRRGNNTVAFHSGHGKPITTVTGYSARIGYDLVTGVGT